MSDVKTDQMPDLSDIPPERRPRHIAVIMDGNGRWARGRGLPRIEGHRNGAKSVRLIVDECVRHEIPCLTLYCLSSENWKRPEHELCALMNLLQQFVIEERATILKKNIRLSVLGRREGIPEDVQADVDRTIAMSAENTGLRLNLAINYGGRGEIIDAVKSLARDVAAGRLDPETIDEPLLESRLYTAGMPEPDLLIRTAGEMRISNFLLWQISYAEIWVTEDFWPDFSRQHFAQAVRDFASRERPIRRHRQFGPVPIAPAIARLANQKGTIAAKRPPVWIFSRNSSPHSYHRRKSTKISQYPVIPGNFIPP